MTEEDRTGDRRPATGNRQSATGLRLGSDIAGRLLELAVAVLRVSNELPREPAGRHVAAQLTRAVTGGGANYEEARAAESRGDFIHKIGVAAKELRETVYWLELIQRTAWTTQDLRSMICEAEELSAILGASARTARSR
jgi:four helix bundle protein